MDNNQNNFNNDMNNYNQVQPQMNEQSQMNPQMNVPPVNQPMSEPVVEEKKKSMLPIIIIAIVVILVAAVVLYFTLGKKSETPSGGGEQTPVDNTPEVKPSTNINGNNCSFDGKIADKAEYVHGQYKYIYEDKIGGWHMVLADKNSTDPVNTTYCKYVNSVPVVSLERAFGNAKTTTVDLSSFDTELVTDMSWMFYDSKITSLDVSMFNTSNVTNMHAMFASMWSFETKLDLSNFDTSNVTDMGHMFNQCQATELVLTSFNTSKVEDIQYMFNQTDNVTVLDLSSFNTSNVKYTSMFISKYLKSLDHIIISKDKWNLPEKVTDGIKIEYK